MLESTLLAALALVAPIVAPLGAPLGPASSSPADPGPAGTGTGDDVAPITWRGDAVPLDSIEASLTAEGIDAEYAARVQTQLAPLGPWLTEHELFAALDDTATVALVTRSKKQAKRRMKLVDETLEAFQEHYAPPDRSGSDETFRVTDWGAGQYRPDQRAVVVCEVHSQRQYAELVEIVGAHDPNPAKDWVETMREKPGFCDGRLAAAGWQEAPDGFQTEDVWFTENELVGRLGRLLLYRSFGPQPAWFDVASAWLMEEEVQGNIYHFPYRFEFVGIGEHSGWKNELRSAFKSRRDEDDVLRAEEFANWPRNKWDDDRAAIAWGLATLLRDGSKGALAALAEDFRLRYKTASIIENGNSWKYVPLAELEPEDQAAALEAAAGEGFLARATEFFRTGRMPRSR